MTRISSMERHSKDIDRLRIDRQLSPEVAPVRGRAASTVSPSQVVGRSMRLFTFDAPTLTEFGWSETPQGHVTAQRKDEFLERVPESHVRGALEGAVPNIQQCNCVDALEALADDLIETRRSVEALADARAEDECRLPWPPEARSPKPEPRSRASKRPRRLPRLGQKRCSS